MWAFQIDDAVVHLNTGRKGRVMGMSRFKYPDGIYNVEFSDENGLPELRWFNPGELQPAALN